MQSLSLGPNDVFVPEEKSWASYDTSRFPDVKIKMSGKIENQKDFDNFIEGWRNLYSRNERFTLTFDTKEVGMVSMKYAFQMRAFIRELKSNYPRLLQKSYISTNSRWVRFLLKVIFFMEKPVADVIIQNELDGSSITVRS